ncbi:hypothetical protein ALC57_03465, partial [Trachymyrmex cornetzi]
QPFGASSPTGRSIKSLVRRASTAVNERGGSGSAELDSGEKLQRAIPFQSLGPSATWQAVANDLTTPWHAMGVDYGQEIRKLRCNPTRIPPEPSIFRGICLNESHGNSPDQFRFRSSNPRELPIYHPNELFANNFPSRCKFMVNQINEETPEAKSLDTYK